MNWIALKDQTVGVNRPNGLDSLMCGTISDDAVIPRGTLMVEFQSDQRGSTQQMLSYGACHPWASGLILSLDGEGSVRMEHWVGHQRRDFVVDAGLLTANRSILVTYRWNSPARTGLLVVNCNNGRPPIIQEIKDPIPFSYRDVARITTDFDHARIGPSTAFVAIADCEMPIGPMPTLTANTLIETPSGSKRLADIKRGDHVVTFAKKVAQVRWSGSMVLPSRGRFQPMKMRAPYFGLSGDLTVASHQKLRLTGVAVDYLFDTDSVTAQAGDLFGGHAVRIANHELTQNYHQLVLDHPAPLRIAGIAIDGLHADTALGSDLMFRNSILANTPKELIPQRKHRSPLLIQAYEAHTLRRHLAA